MLTESCWITNLVKLTQFFECVRTAKSRDGGSVQSSDVSRKLSTNTGRHTGCHQLPHLSQGLRQLLQCPGPPHYPHPLHDPFPLLRFTKQVNRGQPRLVNRPHEGFISIPIWMQITQFRCISEETIPSCRGEKIKVSLSKLYKSFYQIR